MKYSALVLFFACTSCVSGFAAECDEFVAWVAPAKDAYQKEHRIYPVPENIQALARRYLPRLWVHPQSWRPIAFEDYLAQAKVVRRTDGAVIMQSPGVQDVAALTHEEQCGLYLEAEEVAPRRPAPAYVQVMWDENPADPADRWTYIKYNLVFDWSGLAAKINWWSQIGALFSGGDGSRWHRLDIHVAAVLAFDRYEKLRLLTLAQHNHQQTYLAGLDFEADQRPHLAAAFRSNELYLDDGSQQPTTHRVVPFFTDVAYLIDPAETPLFWAIDLSYGRHAGGQEIPLTPVFIAPQHPLEDFAGLLAPPRRLLGMYIGRDGPPGYNYYALPAYIALTDFAAMGFWREGEYDLLRKLKPLIGDKHDMRGTNWQAMVRLMRNRLGQAVAELPIAEDKQKEVRWGAPNK
ncbi:MAG: hypothetical protein JSW39_08515 [Desulfobacterales bacterium]|nr:MAG: hypothetical protein JSW39_08515 [Desulfobacterales bacterium]